MPLPVLRAARPLPRGQCNKPAREALMEFPPALLMPNPPTPPPPQSPNPNTQPQVYAFKRLCRGLGSSRQGARQGFALAITSLLGATECVGPSEAVAAIEGVLEPVGKVGAQASVAPPALPVLPTAAGIGPAAGGM